MKPYHYAWLMRHPERTSEWLKKKLKDGFDIHHLDGNHDNNTPYNLVLIECRDHMLVHGADMSRIANAKKAKENKDGRLRFGAQLYQLRKTGRTWRQCYKKATGVDDPHQGTARAIKAAKDYAKSCNLPWPVTTL